MSTRYVFAVLVGILLLSVHPLHAEVQVKAVEYKDGNQVLQGIFAWDDALEGRRPGIILVHEWWGLNDYIVDRARQLAALGYVAFAIDMYGEGKVTKHPKQAKEWMQQINSDVVKWQRRALVGLDVLRTHEYVDPTRLAAMGYCFGGATVLQMAYSGADLKGVASFHGALPVPTEAQARSIRSSLFIAHGNQDAFVPAERIAEFITALEAAGADWQMTYYGGARHAFTVPHADDYGIENLEYNAKADRRSWGQLRLFLEEVFSPN